VIGAERDALVALLPQGVSDVAISLRPLRWEYHDLCHRASETALVVFDSRLCGLMRAIHDGTQTRMCFEKPRKA